MPVRPSASAAVVVRLLPSNVTVKVKTAGCAVLGLIACKAPRVCIVQLGSSLVTKMRFARCSRDASCAGILQGLGSALRAGIKNKDGNVTKGAQMTPAYRAVEGRLIGA